MTTTKGVDVSEFQHESLIDWGAVHATLGIDFGIARATYGTRADKRTAAHVARMRAAGVVPGLYHFFRADLTIPAQLEAFGSVADAINLGDGDLLPAVDVEAFPDQWASGKPTRWARPCPAWCSPLRDLIGALADEHGGVLVYITQADWSVLGRPDWLLLHHLWVAHWPKTGSTSPLVRPATPGGVPWSLWQQMVGPLGSGKQDPSHPRAVDQDVALLPLPTIGGHVPQPSTELEPELVLTDEDREAMRAEREQAVAEYPDGTT